MPLSGPIGVPLSTSQCRWLCGGGVGGGEGVEVEWGRKGRAAQINCKRIGGIRNGNKFVFSLFCFYLFGQRPDAHVSGAVRDREGANVCEWGADELKDRGNNGACTEQKVERKVFILQTIKTKIVYLLLGMQLLFLFFYAFCKSICM